MSAKHEIALDINGRRHDVSVEPRRHAAIGIPGAVTELPVTPQRLRAILKAHAEKFGFYRWPNTWRP